MNAWGKGGRDGFFGLVKKASTWNLKIMIVSTPKTGNTWLKSLLASLYDLPIAELPFTFHPEDAQKLGPRWITHQHYMCDSHLLNWAKQHKVVLITTVRHPGDILVSLYHYVHNYHTTKEFGEGLATLVADQDEMGQHTLAFVEHFFYFLLNISATWIYARESHIVRYEDLWRDPIAVLEDLTARIHPIGRDMIERVVEQHDINLVRRLSGTNSIFFRQGSIGGWHNTIPAPIVDRLGQLEPYPALFAVLGYTLDPRDPLMALPAKPRPALNPFRDASVFTNGVAVPPVAVRLYLEFESAEAHRRWPDATDTQSPNSFYAWLNAPADQDKRRDKHAPIISNLAAYIYYTHPGMRAKYPDLYGRGRVDWAFWFLKNAPKDYDLDDTFVQPVRDSLLAWLQQPSADDPNHGDALPAIGNLAAYIYRSRPDVQAVYPDLYGHDRVKYLLWLLQHGLREHELEPSIARPFQQHFLAWVNAPDPADPQAGQPVPLITRLAAHVYRTRPDLQQTFPDLYGKHRLGYVACFVGEHGWLPGVTRSVIQSWAQSCLHDNKLLRKNLVDG